MKTNKEIEEEFDEKFVEMHFFVAPILYDMEFEKIDKIKFHISQIRQQDKQEIIEMIKSIPTQKPGYESDDLDRGRYQMKNEILELLS